MDAYAKLLLLALIKTEEKKREKNFNRIVNDVNFISIKGSQG